jgi:hypothetical protein
MTVPVAIGVPAAVVAAGVWAAVVAAVVGAVVAAAVVGAVVGSGVPDEHALSATAMRMTNKPVRIRERAIDGILSFPRHEDGMDWEFVEW